MFWKKIGAKKTKKWCKKIGAKQKNGVKNIGAKNTKKIG